MMEALHWSVGRDKPEQVYITAPSRSRLRPRLPSASAALGFESSSRLLHERFFDVALVRRGFEAP
jgi:hypothetical protein